MPEAAAQSDWIPIALSADIEAGSAAPAIVAGCEVAVWRDESGVVHAWRDRCPHRGMRLSFGFVRGDVLTCLYHGWRYGADGACRFIPAHPDLTPPRTICTSVYPCIEQGGLVWMVPGDAGGPPAAAPALESEAIPVRSLAIDAPSDVVFDMLGRLGGAVALAPTVVSMKLPGSEGSTETLIAALQPVSETSSMLHLLVPPAATGDRAFLQTRASRWGEQFRRSCEASCFGSTASASQSEGVAT